jgi:hypothetical protein
MQVEELCFVSKIENFKELKGIILEKINSMGQLDFNNSFQNICHTDYHLNNAFERPYVEFIQPSFVKHLTELNSTFGYDYFEFGYIWFQQYEKNGFHPWHCHPDSTFSNIAFIELPSSNVSTQIKIKDYQFSIDVKEGEILSMPGSFLHCSPINKSKRKTVVVCNTFNYVS